MPVEEEDMYEELGSEEWCDSGGTGGGRSGGGGGGGSLCGGGGAGRGLSCFLDMPGEDLGEQMGLADGERMDPLLIRSRRGGTGGRLRCWTHWLEFPPWAFLCWLTGEELGDTTGDF